MALGGRQRNKASKNQVRSILVVNSEGRVVSQSSLSASAPEFIAGGPDNGKAKAASFSTIESRARAVNSFNTHHSAPNISRADLKDKKMTSSEQSSLSLSLIDQLQKNELECLICKFIFCNN